MTFSASAGADLVAIDRLGCARSGVTDQPGIPSDLSFLFDTVSDAMVADDGFTSIQICVRLQSLKLFWVQRGRKERMVGARIVRVLGAATLAASMLMGASVNDAGAATATASTAADYVYVAEYPSEADCRAAGHEFIQHGAASAYICVPVTGTTRWALGIVER
jgi:hypothetical protein